MLMMVTHVRHVQVLYTSPSTFFLYATRTLNKRVQTLNAGVDIGVFFTLSEIFLFHCAAPGSHYVGKFVFPSVYCESWPSQT